MRLNQYIARATGISRRKADEVIASKRVKVNGHPGNFSDQIQAHDVVELHEKGLWKNVSPQDQSNEVILMYKPPGFMTTKSDPQGRRTIYELLPQEYKRFNTAGRLDYNSEGLLVLSANGNTIFRLTHPKFKSQKKYLVGLSSVLTSQQIARARSGDIVLDGYKLNPVTIEKGVISQYQYLNLESNLYWYNFTLSEGRNRQIRKMCAMMNNPVQRLIRIAHGDYYLDSAIVRGGWRKVELT